MNRIDGKKIALEIRESLKDEVAALVKEGIRPGLSVILVGDDPASHTYVANKEKGCEEIGIQSQVFRLPEGTSQEELHGLIDRLNADQTVHGILVQLPLPKHLNANEALRRIDPDKDVDGLHVLTAGRLMVGERGFTPCTPKGIVELIRSTNQPIEGKHCVIVGRSNIVGKPMAILMLNENATVTICHSKTHDLPKVCATADILIAAIGKPLFVKKEFVKPGAIVIDVGTAKLNGKTTGDVDFEDVADVASHITPVPGGVGPMTITMLLKNTVESARNHGIQR